MTLLDNIENTTIDCGRLFSSQPAVKYVSIEKFVTIHFQCQYWTWFSISLKNIDENNCLNLTDVLSGVHFIKNVSPVYIVKSLCGHSLTSAIIGINSDVRSVKDAVKFLWVVSSAFWNSFGDVCLTVDVMWSYGNDLKGYNSFKTEVNYDSFLSAFKGFDAYRNHNSLRPSERDASIIHHLIERPVSTDEVKRMKNWCLIHNALRPVI